MSAFGDTSPLPRLGAYLLVREIEAGANRVWEARDPRIGRRITVRELVLPTSLSATMRIERIDRFAREARALGTMNHPNIVTIHEVSEDNGRYFIAMEYLDGEALRDRLSREHRLPTPEATQIAAALCDALRYAHENGVIHRDIKPQNIHLLPDQRVKLTDFGLALITNEHALTIDGQVVGTAAYMSPEQVLGKPLDARSDIFALGILLYEMLTGARPFAGDSLLTITYSIIHEPMPALPTTIPAALAAAVQQALAKEPSDRFSSAADFAHALRAAFSPDAPAATVPPPEKAATPRLEPHSPAVRENRRAAAHTLFLLLLILVLSALALLSVWALTAPYRLPPDAARTVAETRRKLASASGREFTPSHRTCPHEYWITDTGSVRQAAARRFCPLV